MLLTKRVIADALGKGSSSVSAYMRAMDMEPGRGGQPRVFTKAEALLMFTADEIVQRRVLGPLPAMMLVGMLRTEIADLFRADGANLWAFLANNPEDGQRGLLGTTTDKNAGLGIMQKHPAAIVLNMHELVLAAVMRVAILEEDAAGHA